MAYQKDGDQKSFAYDMTDIVKMLTNSVKDGFNNMRNDVYDLADELSNAQVDLIDTGNIDDAAKKLAEVRDNAEAISRANGYNNIKLGNAIKRMDDLIESMKQINKAVVELGNAVTNPFEKLFGFLTRSKIINAIMPPDFKDRLDGIRKSFIDNLTKLADSGQLNLRNFTTEIGTMINGYIKLFGTFVQSLVTNPSMVALAITIGLIYAAFKLFTRMQDAAIKFRKDSGVAADQSKIMEKSALSIANSSGQYGMNLEQVQSAQSALIKNYNVIGKVSNDLVTTSAFLAENWGLSNDESAELLRNMKANGNATDQMAVGLTSAAIELSKAADLAPGEVLKDMATNSETINKYFRGNNKLAILQTVQLHKMGLELKDMSKITDGLLDFDSSIEREMYASVLLNKQLDLSNARMKAFEGKTSEAVEDMLNQVGNFSKLNSIQKKSVSEALGMSEDQITKSIELLNVQRKMTPEERKRYEFLKSQLDITKEMTVQQLLSDSNRQLEMQKFSAAWSKLSTNLATILLPIFNLLAPAMSGIAWIFSKIGDLINVTNDILSKIPGGGIIAAILGGLVGLGLLKVLSKGISSIFKNLFGGIVEIVGKASEGIGKGIGKAVKSLSESVKGISASSMLKGAAAMAIFAGAIWLLGNALKQFVGIDLSHVAIAGAAIGVLMVAMWGLGKIMNSEAIVAILIGIGVIAALGATLLLVGTGLQAIVSAIQTKGLLENLIALSMVSPLLMVAAAGILALSYALMTFAGASVLSGITQFFTGNPFQKFMDFANTAPQLLVAATSLNIIQSALQSLNNVDISNFSKIADGLKKITSALPDNTSFAINGGFTSTISSINGTNNNLLSGTQPGTPDKYDEISKKMDVLIGMLKDGFGVYLDGKKVGEQLNRSKTNSNVC